MDSIVFASEETMFHLETIRYDDIDFYKNVNYITKREEMILKQMKGTITISDLKEELPMSETEIRLCLASLEKKKLIRKYLF